MHRIDVQQKENPKIHGVLGWLEASEWKGTRSLMSQKRPNRCLALGRTWSKHFYVLIVWNTRNTKEQFNEINFVSNEFLTLKNFPHTRSDVQPNPVIVTVHQNIRYKDARSVAKCDNAIDKFCQGLRCNQNDSNKAFTLVSLHLKGMIIIPMCKGIESIFKQLLPMNRCVDRYNTLILCIFYAKKREVYVPLHEYTKKTIILLVV